MDKKHLLPLLFWQLVFGQLAAQQGSLIIQPGASLRVSGAVNIELQKTDWRNSGYFSESESTLKLSGQSAQNAIGGSSNEIFRNLKIASPAGQTVLEKQIQVQGNLEFEAGALLLNGNLVIFHPPGKLENESENSRAVVGANGGQLTVPLLLNAPSAENPANLGAVISTPSNLGATYIYRGHLPQTGGCGVGIARYFDIQNSNPAASATLRLYYFDAELNGISENELTIFRSTNNGSTWADIGFSSRNSTENWIEITGLSDYLGKFTLGSAADWLSPKTWYKDADGDGFTDGAFQNACDAPANYVDAATAGDCDETNPAIHPSATELPDDGIDQNCDANEHCFVDADNDGARLAATTTSADLDCLDANEGRAADPLDCDDTNANIRPGMAEITGDGTDQNCDGAELCFRDLDNDGYRANASFTIASADADCSDGGEALGSDPIGDCADNDAARFPGNPETCDGKDNDCLNGVPYAEADADGDGWRICAGDCADGDFDRNPGAAEFVCNQLDDDCDGSTDEGTDVAPPQAICWPNAEILLLDGTATASSALLNGGCVDACSGTNLSLSIISGQTVFDCDDLGQTFTLVLEVTDAASNTATCSASVAVSAGLEYEESGRRLASDGAANDKLGWSLSLNGSAAVAGAPDAKIGTANKQGAAYVFRQNHPLPNAWGQWKKLAANDGALLDYLGNAAALDGERLLVGAYGDNVGASADQGSAYIFERDLGGANNWGQAKKLTASDGAAYAYFGAATAVQGSTGLVGANKTTISGASARGAAYLFQKDLGGADNWGEAKKLLASDGAASNLFGHAVGLGESGALAAVGAPGNSSNRGAAYLFQKNLGGADNWGQLKKLTATDASTGDWLGASLSLSNDYALVGAPNKGGYKGAAYVFQKNLGGADNWGQAKKLVASDGAANDKFGWAVALSGDYAYVGAPGNGAKGAVYVFQKDLGGPNNWGQAGKYTASDGATGDQYGYSLAASGAVLAAGANLDDQPSKADQGSMYILSGAYACGSGMAAPNDRNREQFREPLALMASPNPFDDELNIETASPFAAQLAVTDAAGRSVMRVELPAGNLRYTLKTNDLQPGIYFVRLANNAGAKLQTVALIR